MCLLKENVLSSVFLHYFLCTLTFLVNVHPNFYMVLNLFYSLRCHKGLGFFLSLSLIKKANMKHIVIFHNIKPSKTFKKDT